MKFLERFLTTSQNTTEVPLHDFKPGDIVTHKVYPNLTMIITDLNGAASMDCAYFSTILGEFNEQPFYYYELEHYR